MLSMNKSKQVVCQDQVGISNSGMHKYAKDTVGSWKAVQESFLKTASNSESNAPLMKCGLSQKQLSRAGSSFHSFCIEKGTGQAHGRTQGSLTQHFQYDRHLF